MTQPVEAIDNTASVTLFHEKAFWTGVMDSDRPKWLEARRRVVTASGVAALLGLHPKLDALGLYVEMVMQQPVNDVQYGLDSPLTWGKALEQSVAETAAKHLNWDLKMSGALLVSRAHPNIGATLDAELIENGKAIVYEGKCTASWRYKDWDEETGKAPDHILVQAQSQLIVTGADTCYVCCLIGGNKFVKVEVFANDELQSLIVETVDEFLDRVSRLEPPQPTAQSGDALKLLYPKDDGSMILLPPESAKWLEKYQELTAKIKASTEEKDAIGNKLKAAIGDCTFGVLPCEVGGKKLLKYALEHKDAYTVKEQNNRVLRQLNQLGKAKK